MEKFIQTVKQIRNLADQYNELRESGMIDNGKSFLDVNRKSMINIMDKIINKAEHANTGSGVLDAFVRDVVTKYSIHTNNIIVIYHVTNPNSNSWYLMHKTKPANQLCSIHYIFYPLYYMIRRSYGCYQYSDMRWFNRDSPYAHSFYPTLAIADAYFDNKANKNKQDDYIALITSLEQKLITTQEHCNDLENEVAILKAKVLTIVPDPIVYDYEDIKLRIAPFRDELIIVQRTFMRILKAQHALPIAMIAKV